MTKFDNWIFNFLFFFLSTFPHFVMQSKLQFSNIYFILYIYIDFSHTNEIWEIKYGKLYHSLAAIICATILPVNGASDWKLNLYKTLNFPPLALEVEEVLSRIWQIGNEKTEPHKIHNDA